jgi:AbrB family looped-hinge helix DNA binding protein
VNESGGVTVPAEIRDRLDIEPGDKLRWRVDDDELGVSVVRQRYGAFDDFEPADLDEETDAVALERGFGTE